MDKLVISSVKIDSVNSVNLPIKQFSEGFNIICGANEAGKSSIMKFLKNSFFNPKDLQGEIELCLHDVNYHIKVQGNKKKQERLKLLAPENKNIEDVVNEINQSFYQKAFVINLDDINTLDNDLFKLIQDHNASEFVAHKNRLKDEINKYLTDTTGKPNKTLNDILKSIKTIEAEIRELSNLENQYAQIISDINKNEKELIDLLAKIKNKTEYENKLKQEAEIQDLENRISVIKQMFNDKLENKKEHFYELTKKTELILGYIREKNTLLSSNITSEIKKVFERIKQEYNIEIDFNNVEGINTSREFEFAVRDLGNKKNQSENVLDNIQTKRDHLEGLINKFEGELLQQNELVSNMKIDNCELNIQGVQELKAAIISLSENSETISNDVNRFQLITSIVITIGLIGIAIYLRNFVGCFIGVSAIVLCVFTIMNLFSKKNKYSSKEIYDYIERDVLPKFNYSGNLLRTIPALNNILAAEEARIREYQILKRTYDEKKQEYDDLQKEFKCLTEELLKENSKIEVLDTELKNMMSVLGSFIPEKMFFDFINAIKDVKTLIFNQKSEQERLQTLEVAINSYLKDFSEFLKITGLEIGLNEVVLSEKTKEIQQLIEDNSKLKHEFDLLISKKSELLELVKSGVTEDLTPEMTSEELEASLEKLKEEKVRLREAKLHLEKFEGLVDLQNRRNLEKCKLREIIRNIYEKKVALNFIQYAEEKQRASEPNLVSAERLLATLTGGKYVKANFSNETITSIDGQTKHSSELSRGTKEQLYLAFRLGYAQNYGADGRNPRLPLIIDDAFVNFDKTRLSFAIEALKEFAKTNQVLFFTCHKEYITGIAGSDVNVVEI